ncbi:hypothetical protein ACJX0J_016462, partial [Zea mays]
FFNNIMLKCQSKALARVSPVGIHAYTIVPLEERRANNYTNCASMVFRECYKIQVVLEVVFTIFPCHVIIDVFQLFFVPYPPF